MYVHIVYLFCKIIWFLVLKFLFIYVTYQPQFPLPPSSWTPLLSTPLLQKGKAVFLFDAIVRGNVKFTYTMFIANV